MTLASIHPHRLAPSDLWVSIPYRSDLATSYMHHPWWLIVFLEVG
jgi:hypothetical protein